MKEKTFEWLFFIAIVIIYSVIGWVLYVKVLKPIAKGAVHYFAPAPIEQHIDSNKSKSRNK
jgi:hypothetical protein